MSTDRDQEKELYDSIMTSPLLHTKGERINLGKYQATTTVSRRMLEDFSVKAYACNVCALLNGHKGTDRRKGPPKVPDQLGLDDDGDQQKPMLKQCNVEAWGDYKNQLDRAGYLFGDIDNFYRQKLICQIIGPTATFHSRIALLL